MATRHQVTCIVPDGADADQRIDAIGGSSGAKDTGGAWKLDIDPAIVGIENGTWDSGRWQTAEPLMWKSLSGQAGASI
jgi:hypothetical protein